jgi:hypothetical protein
LEHQPLSNYFLFEEKNPFNSQKIDKFFESTSQKLPVFQRELMAVCGLAFIHLFIYLFFFLFFLLNNFLEIC